MRWLVFLVPLIVGGYTFYFAWQELKAKNHLGFLGIITLIILNIGLAFYLLYLR